MNFKTTVLPSELMPILSGLLSIGLIILSIMPMSYGSLDLIIICSLAVYLLIPACAVILRYCITVPTFEKFSVKRPDTRANLSLAVGTVFNISYSVYKLSYGLKYSSVWFVSVAVYYTLLSLIKAVLLAGRSDGNYSRICKFCGISILFLNIAVGIVTFSMIFGDRLYFYNGMSLPISAAYTLFRISAAIFIYIKSKKRISEIYRAAKYVNLSTAILSVYSFETALLDKYGIISPESRRPFNILLGSAATAILITVSAKVIKIGAVKHKT